MPAIALKTVNLVARWGNNDDFCIEDADDVEDADTDDVEDDDVGEVEDAYADADDVNDGVADEVNDADTDTCTPSQKQHWREVPRGEVVGKADLQMIKYFNVLVNNSILLALVI